MEKVDKIIKGLQLLKTYGKPIDCAGAHDTFYAGFRDDLETMSPQDKQNMDDLGWFEDEENGGFGIFV